MSSGKKKKPTKKSASGASILPIILGAVAGVLIVGALIWGGMSVMGQRKTVAGYDTSVTKITEALRTRNPESPEGALKLSEIDALVTGGPTVTRETKEGAEHAVYTWSSSVGFRLKLEKNGPTDEVVELVTLGAK
jgi:hypothetical protein